ncbi:PLASMODESMATA CALLOSE-BINDING PROTEIN 5 [Striga hermonthica]|uniref:PLASMODESMATA CALLOSE-BINDING PROTEIN 5 n=1 Tax=Striga hermonthica TaxID=68872 RepID=A0A9N7MU74_STRHE|nr:PLASMODESMATA CALLOSE-BINDING PROTEIN 5 [Striga hermonthica]
MGAGNLIGPLSLLLFPLISTLGSAAPLWCVAKNNAEDAALQQALNWACGQVDCGPIQIGRPCYVDSDLQHTASYAFNAYYLAHALSDDACNFGGNAALTNIDPSHGNCRFPSSSSSGNGSLSGAVPAGSADLNGSSCSSRASPWDLGDGHGSTRHGIGPDTPVYEPNP